MQHPFDGLSSAESLPTRRAVFGHMAAAVAGVAGLAGTAAAGEADLSTQAVGEEGGKEDVLQRAVSTRAIGEEGGYYYQQPLPRPQPADLKPEQMQTAWNDLADPGKAHLGVQQLISAKQAVPFLKDKLEPAQEPKLDEVAQWVADLDHEQFAARQKATRALEKMGPFVEPALRKVLEGKPPLEVRSRIENILNAIKNQRIQLQYGLAVLSMHGTADALKLLITLSNGPKEALLTTEAQTAVASMNQFCWNGWAQRGAVPAYIDPRLEKLRDLKLQKEVQEQNKK